MFSSILRAILGSIVMVLVGLNAIAVAALIIIFYLLSFILIVPSWRHIFRRHVVQRYLPWWFAFFNRYILTLTTHNKWDVAGEPGLLSDGSYLMVANHQSWADILVLSTVFNRKIPPLKFFIKKELLWQLPIIGFAMYALGYPVIARHSHAEIRKNPKLKGKDIQTTRKACQQLKTYPATLINFVEGTRFTQKKYIKQQSPFKHLLKPRAGGISIVLQELQDMLNGIVNVTILYPGEKPTFWEFFCGKFDKIIVRYDILPITSDLIGDYPNDRAFRVVFQQWLNTIWQKNDDLIDSLVKKNDE